MTSSTLNKFPSYTCPYWDVSHCSTFHLTPVHINKCCFIWYLSIFLPETMCKTSIWQAVILTRRIMYHFCRVQDHIDTWHIVQCFCVTRVEFDTWYAAQVLIWHTYPYSHVAYCTTFHMTRVNIDACHTVHLFSKTGPYWPVVYCTTFYLTRGDVETWGSV